jgi:histidinol phosphatase-like PHP family hydrolase
MLSSFQKLSEGKGSNWILNGFKEIPTSFVGRNQESEELKPITEHINLKNIEFDPHLHSSLSDGIDTMHDARELASELGLEVIAFADHHRDELDGVVLYNDDAYRIAELEGDDRLSANMDILYSVWADREADVSEDIVDLDNSEEALRDFAKAYGVDFESLKLNKAENSRDAEKFLEMSKSIERDYESWNDQKTAEFIEENDFDHVVLSTHYIPEEFIEGNKHEKQTQYLRKADLEHLEDSLESHDKEDVVDWYVEETKAKLLRSADLTGMSNREAKKLYETHEVDLYRDIEELKKPIAGDTPIIHSHWDLILTSPDLRPEVEEEHIDEYLDLAEELGERVEVNGRTIMKQRKTYVSDDNFYAPEDSEWFARKVIERAEDGDLEYTIASDAHSEMEMIKQHSMLDSILEDYETKPLGSNL